MSFSHGVTHTQPHACVKTVGKSGACSSNECMIPSATDALGAPDGFPPCELVTALPPSSFALACLESEPSSQKVSQCCTKNVGHVTSTAASYESISASTIDVIPRCDGTVKGLCVLLGESTGGIAQQDCILPASRTVDSDALGGNMIGNSCAIPDTASFQTPEDEPVVKATPAAHFQGVPFWRRVVPLTRWATAEAGDGAYLTSTDSKCSRSALRFAHNTPAPSPATGACPSGSSTEFKCNAPPSTATYTATQNLSPGGFVAPIGGFSHADMNEGTGFNDARVNANFTMVADPEVIRTVPRVKVPRTTGFSMRDWSIHLCSKLHKSRQGNESTPSLPRLTAQVVAQHNTADSLWMVIRGVVYDCTHFQHFHPGGEKLLQQCAGHDATAVYDAFHPWVSVESMLAPYKVGFLDQEGTLKEALYTLKR